MTGAISKDEKIQINKLILGNITSKMGNSIYTVTMTCWITSTFNSAKILSLFLTANILPVMFFSILFGVVADNLNSKKLVVMSDLSNALINFIILVLINKNCDIRFLIILSFLSGGCNALFKPCYKTIFASIVNKKNILEANTQSNFYEQLVKIISPLIATFLMHYGKKGINFALVLNIITFFVSAFIENSIKFDCNKNKKVKIEKFKTEFIDMLNYVSRKSLIKIALLCAFIGNIFAMCTDIVLPLFTKDMLFLNNNVYSLAITLFSVGEIVASYLALYYKNNDFSKVMFLTLSCVGGAIWLMGFKFAITILMANFLMGFFISFNDLFFFNHLYNIVEKKYIGRVFSLIYTIVYFISAVAYILYGVLEPFLHEKIFFGCGIALVITGLLSLYVYRMYIKI